MGRTTKKGFKQKSVVPQYKRVPTTTSNHSILEVQNEQNQDSPSLSNVILKNVKLRNLICSEEKVGTSNPV